VQWGKGFKALEGYEQEHGNCLVSKSFKERGFPLGQWVSNQRKARDGMPDERKQRLEALAFVWNVENEVESKLQQLIRCF